MTYTPPPALVEKVNAAIKATRAAAMDDPNIVFSATVDRLVATAALTASGMGALVALIERVGALQKSSANPELFPIIDDARTLLATLATTPSAERTQ